MFFIRIILDPQRHIIPESGDYKVIIYRRVGLELICSRSVALTFDYDRRDFAADPSLTFEPVGVSLGRV